MNLMDDLKKYFESVSREQFLRDLEQSGFVLKPLNQTLEPMFPLRVEKYCLNLTSDNSDVYRFNGAPAGRGTAA